MGAGDGSSVRVALRVRPLSTQEAANRSQMCLRAPDATGTPQVVLGKDRSFTYDYLFHVDSSQAQVHDKAVEPLLNCVFEGYNATILAYGQTGSGKTYTMGSGVTGTEDDEVVGVIPRVIDGLFERMAKATAEDPTLTFSVRTSFLELYKEDVRDMLNQQSYAKKTLPIREDTKSGTIVIPGLTENEVSTRDACYQQLLTGSQCRTTSSTLMNATSSRSHAIFTIILEQQRAGGSGFISKFNFVDLAGSERVKRTGAAGLRLKEGIAINSGLLALGNVISALGAEKRTANKHIPYRDSKLTRMLQDSLGGNSRTLMIACVSPADVNFEETLNTLKYADRARRIKNKPIVNLNTEPSAALVNQLRAKIDALEKKLSMNNNNKDNNKDSNSNADEQPSSEEVQRLTYENERLQEKLLESESKISGLNEDVIQAQRERDEARIHLKHVLVKVEGHGIDTKALALGGVQDEKELETNEKHLRMIQEMQRQLDDSDKKLARYRLKLREARNGSSLGSRLEAVKRGNSNSNSNSKRSLSTASLGRADGGGSVDDDVLLGGDGLLRDRSGSGSGQDEGEESDNEDHDNDDVTADGMRAQDEEFLATQERLYALNHDIQRKENIIQEIVQTAEQMESMKAEYEAKLKGLEGKLSSLQEERDRVMKEMETKKQMDEAQIREIKTQYEKKIVNLREEMQKHKRMAQEHMKLIKLRQENTRSLKRLKDDLQSMKKVKVDLSRKLEVEAKKREQARLSANRELSALRKELRKNQLVVGQLKSKNERQNRLLQRRLEEVQNAQRRVRDIQRATSGVKGRNSSTNSNNSNNTNSNNTASNNTANTNATPSTPRSMLMSPSSKRGHGRKPYASPRRGPGSNRPATASSASVLLEQASAATTPTSTKDRAWRKAWLQERVQTYMKQYEARSMHSTQLAKRDEVVHELEGLVAFRDEMVEASTPDEDPVLQEVRSRIESLEAELEYVNEQIMEAQRLVLMATEGQSEDIGGAEDFVVACKEEISQMSASEARSLLTHTLLTALGWKVSEKEKRECAGQLDAELKTLRRDLKESRAISADHERRIATILEEKEKEINAILSEAIKRSRQSIQSTATDNAEPMEDDKSAPITSNTGGADENAEVEEGDETSEMMELKMVSQQGLYAKQQQQQQLTSPAISTTGSSRPARKKRRSLSVGDVPSMDLPQVHEENNTTTTPQDKQLKDENRAGSSSNNSSSSSNMMASKKTATPHNRHVATILSNSKKGGMSGLFQRLPYSPVRPRGRKKRSKSPVAMQHPEEEEEEVEEEGEEEVEVEVVAAKEEDKLAEAGPVAGVVVKEEETENENSIRGTITRPVIPAATENACPAPAPILGVTATATTHAPSAVSSPLGENSANVQKDVWSRLNPSLAKKPRTLMAHREPAAGPDDEENFCELTLQANDIILSMCSGYNNAQIFGGSADATANLYDLEKQELVRTFKGHSARVSSIVSSIGADANHPAANMLFTGSADEMVKVWDPSNGKCTETLSVSESSGKISSIALSDNYLFAGHEAGCLRVWDIRTWQPVKTQRNLPVYSLFAGPNDYLFCGLRGGNVVVYDRANLEIINKIEYPHSSNVLCFAASGSSIYSGGIDKCVKQYYIGEDPRKRFTETNNCSAHREAINAMCIHNDVLYTASSDHTIGRFDIHGNPSRTARSNPELLAKRKLAPFKGHKHKVLSLVAQGDHLITGSYDKTVKIWRIGQEN